MDILRRRSDIFVFYSPKTQNLLNFPVKVPLFVQLIISLMTVWRLMSYKEDKNTQEMYSAADNLEAGTGAILPQANS